MPTEVYSASEVDALIASIPGGGGSGTFLAWAKTLEDFGAVGDGATDDSGAFNAAVASGVPYVIGLPGKTYGIASMVDLLSSRQTWLMNSAKVKVLNGFAQPAKLCALNLGAPYITVRDIEVDANRTNVNGFHVSGIHIAASNCNLISANVHDAHGYGIAANNQSGTRISRCVVSSIRDNLYGINVHNIGAGAPMVDIDIHDCTIDLTSQPVGTTSVGILVRGDIVYLTSRASLTGNKIIHRFGANDPGEGAVCCELRHVARFNCDRNYMAGGCMGVSFAQSVRGTCHGNIIEAMTEIGIEDAASQEVSYVGNVINGNSIAGTRGYAFQGADQIFGTPFHARVNGGIVKGCASVYTQQPLWSSVNMDGVQTN